MPWFRIVLAACCLTAAGGLAALAGAWAAPAVAADNAQATWKKECGACHMAFQPEFLPARSWAALMAGLGNHFGENATLDAATSQAVLGYLQAHAADAGGGYGHHHNHALRGLSSSDTPLRITETPHWVREHRREIATSAFSNPKVKSKANCVACHAGAEQGYYDDDD